MNTHYSDLLTQLFTEMRAGMPPEMRHRLVTASAAAELLMTDLEAKDAEALRVAVARYVLLSIGISDAEVESARLLLLGTPGSQLSAWRH